MRGKTSRFLAAALAVVLLVCQTGLTVRGAEDTGTPQPDAAETVSGGAAAPTEDGAPGDQTDAGVPAAPPEEGAPGAQEGNTGPEVSQPEDGGDASGDNAVLGTDGTPAPEGGQSAPDGPTFDGLIIPVPSPTLTPEPTEEPAPTDEPEATEEPAPTQEPEAAPSAGTPFAEGMLAFGSEEEALAYLWSLEGGEYGIMPIGEAAPNTPVDAKYFRFSIYSANEANVQTDTSGNPRTYDSYTALTQSDMTVAPGWTGPDGGDVQGENSADVLATYPQIENYRISSIRVNGTNIYHLGMYYVGGNTYVHFTAIDTQGRMTTVVLTSDTYATAPFEVRYVPDEYDIGYEVYVGSEPYSGSDAGSTLDDVFGENRATTTADHWASVDVSIPAGYTGRVYVYDTGTVFANEEEVFQQETTYGNYPLGAEPEYELISVSDSENHIAIKAADADTPGSYTLTGTYLVGSSANRVAANKTVRVVLTKKQSITFHAELWRGILVGQSTTENKVNVDGGNWTVTSQIPDDAAKTGFTWTFTVKDSYVDGSTGGSTITDAELRSMEINGAELDIPYVDQTDAAGTTASAESTLPSGATVTITVSVTSNQRRQYTISVTDASRDVWITGGAVTYNDPTYKELITSVMSGVEVQAWMATNTTTNPVTGWYTLTPGLASCTGYSWSNGSYEDNRSYAGLGDPGFKYFGRGTGTTSTGEQLTGNIRFRPENGYVFAGNTPAGIENYPTVQLVDKDGEVHNSSVPAAGSTGVERLTITGPDTEGWYYATLVSPYGTTAQEALAETMNEYLLEVRAYPEQYIVSYHNGIGDDLNAGIDGKVGNMPDYSSNNGLTGYPTVDTNRHNYYSEVAGGGSYSGGEASDSITVSDMVPFITLPAGSREVTFLGWVLTDASGVPYQWNDITGDGLTIEDTATAVPATESSQYPVIQPTDLLELSNIKAASNDGNGFSDTRTEYAIYLTALWSTPAGAYEYFVTFNYTDAAGNPHGRVDATATVDSVDNGPYEFAAGDGNNFNAGPGEYYVARRDSYFDTTGLDGLSVVFDPDKVDSVTVPGVDWQWYKYDDRANTQNGSAGDIYKWSPVADGGEVDVWFISTLGQLTISKTVNDAFTGVEDPADGVDFEFTVEFTLPETNDPGTDGDESHYFGDGSGGYAVSYTMSGAGAPTGPQTMVLTQDGNKYTGTLTLKGGQNAVFDLPAGTVYTVTETPLDNWTVASQNPTGTIAAATPTEAAFTNTPTGVVVTKEQAEIPGAVNGSGGTAPTDDAFTTELLRIGGRSTVQYKITVWNYNVAGGTFTVTDKVPEADVQPGDSGDHRKPMVIKEGPYGISQTNGVQGALTDPEAGQGPQEGLEVGGTVKWENVPIAQGASATFTFSVVYPIVLHTHTFTNTADVAWNTTQTAQSNSVDVRVYEDWLRIGKVAYDPNGELFAPDQTFHFTLTLTQGTAGAAPENEYNYTYRLAEGYSAGDVVVPEESEGHGFTLTGDGNGHFGFDLKAGQAITIFGLAPGIQYTVTEDSVAHYTSSGIQARPGTVLENNWGTISATSDDWVYFANTYEPEAATVAAPAVTKTLTGRALQAGEFAFTMTAEPAAGVTLPANAANATNDADGKVTFGDITFTSAGTYTVTIREVRGSDTHVSYDAHAYTVTYTVTDNNGILTAAQGAATGASAFANTYTPNAATAAAPAVTKTLTGRALQAGEFTFTMTAEPAAGVTLPANAANDADGKVAFGDITFTSAGTYTITVREVNNGLPGVTYDGHAYTMTYTVTDNNGELVVVPGAATGESAFANTYTPNAVTAAAPAVTKTLTGRALQAGEFEFEMTADTTDGITLPGHAFNDADGKVIFNDITFTSAGTYTVTIREVRGSDTHVSYDAHAYTVTYTVTDNNGTLVAVPGAATGASAFANTYTPNAVTAAAPAVTKTLTGRALQAGEFTFEMTAEPAEGVTLPANAANDADGKVAFGDITFTSAGTYTLTIREVKGADANVTYDEHAYTVTYTVTDDGGELVAVPGAATGESAFANTYSAPAETPPPTAEPTATPAPTDAPAATAAPTAEPAATAAPTAEPAATTAPTDAPAATAAPTDAGANDVPKTGDENEPALWAAMAAGCMLTLAGILILRRRKDRN